MEKIIHILKEFNFTESEAKAYMSILQNGPCTGYEASKLSGVPRSKIYNILENLTNRGALVTSDGEKRILYRAEPVSRLKKLLQSAVEDNLAALEAEAGKFAKPKDDERIWRLFDYKGIVNKCLEMVEEAKEQVIVQIWVDDLEDRLVQCLNQKMEEMEKVLIVLYDSREEYKTGLKKFYRHGFEHEKLNDIGHRWLTITCDGREMIHGLVRNATVAEAVYTKNESMVFFADEYVCHDAYCLRLIDKFGDRVKEEFGEHMEGIRDVFRY